MALETATYISGLVASNPPGTDPKSQADDHLRLIKATILNTFPNVNGAITATHTELNYVDGVTSSIQTQLDSKLSSASLSGITAATAANTIDNGAHDQVWKWSLAASGDVGFTIGETSASVNGSGSQDLFSVGTIAASTANPFRVLSRSNTAFLINYLGAMTIAAPTAYVAGNAPAIALSTGAANTSGNGGGFNVTLGAGVTNAGVGGNFTALAGTGGGTTGTGGGMTLTAGAAPSGGTGGAALLRGGSGGTTGVGGAANVLAGQGGATSGAGGAVNITAGLANSGTGGDVVLTTGTGTTNGKVNFVNTNVANGTVACVLTASSGPTGASTAVQGWLAIKVGGTSRYVPYW